MRHNYCVPRRAVSSMQRAAIRPKPCIFMVYIVMVYIAMAHIVMAYIVMTHRALTYKVMAYIAMTYMTHIATAYIVMAYIVMAYRVTGRHAHMPCLSSRNKSSQPASQPARLASQPARRIRTHGTITKTCHGAAHAAAQVTGGGKV